MGSGSSSKMRAPGDGENGASTLELPPSTLPEFYFSIPLSSMANLKAILHRILEMRDELDRLYEFLKTEFSEELIDFYVVVREYNGLSAVEYATDAARAEAIWAKAEHIYRDYVAPGSEYDVNISNKTKTECENAIKGGGDAAADGGGGSASPLDPHLFDKCVADVIDMLAKDKLLRFIEVRKVEDEWNRQRRAMCEAAARNGSAGEARRKDDGEDDELADVAAPPEEFLLSPEFLHHDLDLAKSRYTPRCDADWSPLPRSVCGAYCAHGVQDRKYKVNQDRGITSYPFAGSRDHALFVNCDGHGPYGHDVADFVVRAVHATLKAHAKLHTDASAALAETVVAVHAALGASDVDSSISGCSLLVTLIVRSDLYVASTGDARATLGREPDESARSEPQANAARDAGRFAELGISRAHKPRLVAEDLTVDQNVDNPAEVDRVEAAGGLVEPAEGYMQNRIWNSERHLGPGLQMTRSVGDHDADRLGVMPDPVVTHRKLHKTDRVLILATDGVWEYITSEMAVRFVELTLGRFKDDAHVAEKAAIVLMKFAMRFWQNESRDYRDDISCTIVRLPPFEERPSSRPRRNSRRITQF